MWKSGLIPMVNGFGTAVMKSEGGLGGDGFWEWSEGWRSEGRGSKGIEYQRMN